MKTEQRNTESEKAYLSGSGDSEMKEQRGYQKKTKISEQKK